VSVATHLKTNSKNASKMA